MNIFHDYRRKTESLLQGLAAEGLLPGGLDLSAVTVEPTQHGDMATNAAMVVAGPARKDAREIGAALAAKMEALPEIREAFVAGPGFVNFSLADAAWTDAVRAILVEEQPRAVARAGSRIADKSLDDPVFNAQFAHARCHSVLKAAREMFPGADLSSAALAQARIEKAIAEDALPLVRRLAAGAREPRHVQDIAAAFHALWDTGREGTSLRFLAADDRELSLARLALVKAVATVLAAGLAVMGIEPLEEMHG